MQGPTAGPLAGAYTVSSGSLSDQLGVREHQALDDLLDRAVDPREVDTLRLEERVAQFSGRVEIPYLPRPSARALHGHQLQAALESALEKLADEEAPELLELRAGLAEVLDEHRTIARARSGGLR